MTLHIRKRNLPAKAAKRAKRLVNLPIFALHLEFYAKSGAPVFVLSSASVSKPGNNGKSSMLPVETAAEPRFFDCLLPLK